MTIKLNPIPPRLLQAADDEDARRLMARAGWTIALFGVLITGMMDWGSWSTWPGEALVAPLIVAVALMALAVVWSVGDPEVRWLPRSILALSAVTVLFSQGVGINARPYYSTDSAAFNDVATKLLIHGHNPYTSSLAGPASKLLRGIGSYWTYTLNGGHVSSVSYPAGSFLFQVPLQLLGFHHLPTDWLDLFAAILSAVLLYRMLPAPIRWLSPTLLLVGFYASVFANGETDALFVPFLLVACWRWDRFEDPSLARWVRWSGPVALGLACTIKQSPWFCVPFLILGVAIEARQAGRSPGRAAATYGGLAGSAFAIVNLPFFLVTPGAWLHSVLLPLTTPLVPDGQGLVTLALHGMFPGVRIVDLTIAAALSLAALVAAFVLWYPKLKRTWLLLLPLTLMIPGRSLSEYLVDFLPVALVAATSVASSSVMVAPKISSSTRRAVVGAALFATVALCWAAFTSPVLSITVDRVTTAPNSLHYISMVVTLRNNTALTVSPSIAVLENKTHPTGFWRTTTSTPIVIGPHETTTVTLLAPPFTPTSLKKQYWIVEAVTPSPAALSTSPAMQWNLGHL